jgi:hypothetical protein
MQKEGIQSAIDFIKYILTLAGGGLAFSIQHSFYAAGPAIRVLAAFGTVLLTISIIAGILAHSSGSVKLSRAEYDQNDPYFRVPGLIMIFSFGIGFVLIIAGVAIKIWTDASCGP